MGIASLPLLDGRCAKGDIILPKGEPWDTNCFPPIGKIIIEDLKETIF